MEPYIENTARTLEHYLHRIGIRLDRLTLREYVDRHPMRHNIRCVSDLLDRFGIDHMACELTWEQLLEIETPCLVQLRTIDDPIGEIVRTTPDTVVLRTLQGKNSAFCKNNSNLCGRGLCWRPRKPTGCDKGEGQVTACAGCWQRFEPEAAISLTQALPESCR